MDSPHFSRSSVAGGLLSSLATKVRVYIVAEGFVLVLAVVGVAAWLSLAVDYSVELDVSWRAIYLALIGAACLVVVIARIVDRLFVRFRTAALALVIERRYPQLEDRLITSVELAESRDLTPLGQQMLAQSNLDLEQLLANVKLSEVFNLRPLIRGIALAVVLFVTFGIWASAQPALAKVWFDRNIRLANHYWPRQTELIVRVIAEPGERLIEFRDGQYRHPRGSNLTVQVETPQGQPLPRQVSILGLFRSVRKHDFMLKVGEEFRYTFPAVNERVELWFYGGDYKSRTPLVVNVVEPPRVDSLVFSNLYPAYTGLNSRSGAGSLPQREDVPVTGTQVSIPAGTDILLAAKTNKVLQGFRLQSENFRLDVSRAEGAKLRMPPDAAPQSVAFAEPPLGSDGRSLSVPLLMSLIPAEQMRVDPAVPLRLPSSAVLQLSLHDEDDIFSPEPIRTTIISVGDEPPRVETRLKGIGPSITRQATIPVLGTVTDDYGIVQPRFDYRIGDEIHSRIRPLSKAHAGGVSLELSERFEVLPLDLAVGEKLTVTISAADLSDVAAVVQNQPFVLGMLGLPQFAAEVSDLLGPHRTQGDRFSFEIVTSDELLAQIAARELNLRQRFEQIITEVKESRKDLQLRRTRAEESRSEFTQAESADKARLQRQLDVMEADLQNAALTAQNRLAKNMNETLSLVESFTDIRDELENNAVPDVKALLARIDEGIVKPLTSVNTKDYPAVDDALTLLRQALEQREPPLSRAEAAIDQYDVTIRHLEEVLVQMLKLESYNEAVQLLREIIKQQEEIKERTRKEQKKALEDLE